MVGVPEGGAGSIHFVDEFHRSRNFLNDFQVIGSVLQKLQNAVSLFTFDTYDGQDVLIFEEFRGGLKHGDMLNYLDGYPLLLPCRYFNRQGCYRKVFFMTREL